MDICLPEKLMAVQLRNSDLLWNPKFHYVFRRAQQWTLLWVYSVQFTSLCPVYFQFHYICVSQAVSSLKVFHWCGIHISHLYIQIPRSFEPSLNNVQINGGVKNLRICSEHTIRNSDITVLRSLLKCLWHGWWRGLALDKLAGFLSPWQMNQRNPTLTFQFTEIGRQLWRNLTQRNLYSLKKWLVDWYY
jgi:hypothetical protein